MIGIKCSSVCLSFISHKTVFPPPVQLSHVLYFMQPGKGSVFLILLSAFSAFIHFSVAYGSGKVKMQ